VHRLTGVLGVTNEIQNQAPRPGLRRSRKDRKALTRVASFEAQDLPISTDGGKLDNWYERDLAETAPWSVPGVTHVQDKISLNW
jgi:osmotically-inducible protein OsmY